MNVSLQEAEELYLYNLYHNPYFDCINFEHFLINEDINITHYETRVEL